MNAPALRCAQRVLTALAATVVTVTLLGPAATGTGGTGPGSGHVVLVAKEWKRSTSA